MPPREFRYKWHEDHDKKHWWAVDAQAGLLLEVWKVEPDHWTGSVRSGDISLAKLSEWPHYETAKEVMMLLENFTVPDVWDDRVEWVRFCDAESGFKIKVSKVKKALNVLHNTLHDLLEGDL